MSDGFVPSTSYNRLVRLCRLCAQFQLILFIRTDVEVHVPDRNTFSDHAAKGNRRCSLHARSDRHGFLNGCASETRKHQKWFLLFRHLHGRAVDGERDRDRKVAVVDELE